MCSMRIFLPMIVIIALMSCCSRPPESTSSQTDIDTSYPKPSEIILSDTPHSRTSPISIDGITPSLNNTITPHCGVGEFFQTPIDVQTPSPTEGGFPSTSSLSMEGGGLIWAQVDGSHLYKLYDLHEGYIGSIFGDMRCTPPLIPGTTKEVCNFDGELGMLNLQNGEEEYLNIPMPDWVEISSNGQFLFYGYLDQELEEQTISIYDLNHHSQNGSIPSIPYVDWPEFTTAPNRGIPGLSNDGNSLVFVQYSWEDSTYYAYEYMIDMNQYHRINTNNLEFAGGLAWSPTMPLLLLGATDIAYFETEPTANYMYVYNADTGVTRPLNNLDGDRFFDLFWDTHTQMYDVWSPDGSLIVLFDYPQADETDQIQEIVNICIISIDSGNFICEPIPITPQSYPWVGNATWSPDGNFVAFTTNRGAYTDGELMIYSLVDQSFNVIDDAPVFIGLYWRR